MRRKQQLGVIVLGITIAGLLIVGAGSVLAQDGNEATATDNTSEYNCTPTEIVTEGGGGTGVGATDTVPTGWVNYTDRVDRTLEGIRQEYGDEPGFVRAFIERDSDTQVCGMGVTQVSVGINSSEFEGDIPNQQNDVDIATQDAEVGHPPGGGGAVGTGGAPSDGTIAPQMTEEMTSEDTNAATTEETTTETRTDSGGKAKQPSDADNDTAEGGNGKAKAD